MGIDMFSAVGGILSPVASFFGFLIRLVLTVALLGVAGFVVSFFALNRLNPFHLTVEALKKPFIRWKWHDLFRWIIVDFLQRNEHIGEFDQFGFTFYVGRQGAGKTISMVRYLERMRAKFPRCLIVTNFSYYQADYIMHDWQDILNVRNGTDGVIFAIDEIHSEYSSAAWKDVPESLLSEISQQRKQRVKIVATAQFFARVAKPLREQANTVVSCSTYFKRLTKNREYDALDYATVVENPNVVNRKVRPISKSSFVQSDALRGCYDTYEKIERMKKIKFIPRSQRGPENA